MDTASEKIDFYSFTREKLEKKFSEMGLPAFRARQLFKWVYGRGIEDISQMTDISKGLREELAHMLEFNRLEVASHKISEDGTQKLLLKVGKGLTVESVLIPSKDRLTLCVSSEVGCNLACQFCYTGKQKLKKRLSAGEIIGQYIQASKCLPEDVRITNIVYMGMGEPLDNPGAVFDSVDILNDPLGPNLSRKRITISTSGIVPLIPQVTESGARLAVSLNGVNDEVRSKIMPINKKWPLKDLLDACLKYTKESGDRVTFEYVLLKGVTDSLEDAKKLVSLTRNIPCKINIIPFNEHPGSGFYRPDEEQIRRFQEVVMNSGAHVLRRRTMGRDIYAACGQLTSMYDGRPEENLMT